MRLCLENDDGLVRETQLAAFSWWDTFYSERGTLIAIAVGSALLWVKARAAGL